MRKQEADSQEVHVGTPIPQCRDINSRLLEDPEAEGGYETEVFENLVYRYEEPNGMTRWDRPLFSVPFDDAESPFEAIWEAIIGSDGKAKVVKPNTATILVWPMPLIPCFVNMSTSTKNMTATSHRIRLPLRAGQNHARSGEFDPRVAERPSWGRRPGSSHRKGNNRVADQCGILAAIAKD